MSGQAPDRATAVPPGSGESDEQAETVPPRPLSPESGKDTTLPQRFITQGGQTYDRWHKEKLSLLTVPGTPGNLARLHDIFAFQSSLLQNIVDVIPDSFQIRVLTQPFTPSPSAALSRLPAQVAVGALRQSLAFLATAREWRIDFVDFSCIQVLPSGAPRFGWKLEPQDLPLPGAIASLFERQGNGAGDRRRTFRDNGLPALADSADYFCRREDFASNLLRSGPPGNLRSCANAKIRVNAKHPWQGTVARDNLFHNLNDAETLLLNIDLTDQTLASRLAALVGGKNAAADDLAAQALEFRLFLKKSVFQRVILLLSHLARKEDDRLLRYLLESGDICGLTAILFHDATACECDLEFNEDPRNLMAGHLPDPTGGLLPPALTESEREILERILAIGVPVPLEIAGLLVPQGDGTAELLPVPQGDGTAELLPAAQGSGRKHADGDALIASLLKEQRLVESKERQGLVVNLAGCPPLARRDADMSLAWLAEHSDWVYARIAHCIAADLPAALEDTLRDTARESPARIAPGPAADLLCRHLPHLPPGNKAWGYGIDILIQGNCLAQAAQVLDAGNGEPCSRLKKAHVAMRRRDYRELGRLLAGMAPPATEFRDEWLYLNSILHEKLAEKSKADAFAKKIKSPYYRNLSLVQQSDRGIYKREFSRVRAQLSGALDFFTAGRRCREVIEAQSQIAKLLREEGDFARSESLYKTIFVQGEAEGLALSSAGAAVDLGNLYAENDDDFQAECWYQKAGRLRRGKGQRRAHAGERQPGQCSPRQGGLAPSRRAAAQSPGLGRGKEAS